MGWQIHNADVLDWCKTYTGPKAHAVLTDPPYNLSDKINGEKGFMSKAWDNGVAFQPATWEALAAHLLPGAFLFAFGGSRTFHRMAVAIEDAGLVLHPAIVWAFGSGFPKATRIDMQVDKAAGVERKIVGEGIYANRRPHPGNGTTIHMPAGNPITAPATPLAAIWEGHRYGRQALKPACEVCITASKPLPVNPFYVTMAEATFLVEAITCLLYSAPDAENLINQTHLAFRQAVGNFAHGNAGVWESLDSVRIAGGNSGSNLAKLTLRDFAAGDALTKDVISQWVKTITYGEVEHLSAWGIVTSESMVSMLQSIVSLWSRYLVDLCNLGSKFTTEMVTSLTTDQKTLRSLLSQITSASITPQSEPSGLLSLVRVAESFLISLLTRLPSLLITIAPESASTSLAQLISAPAGSAKDGANLEFIVVAQVPYEGRPVDSITATGAGALWIDGGRIETNGESTHGSTRGNGSTFGGNGNCAPIDYHPAGRWPSNLILSEEAAARMDEMSGELGNGYRPNHSNAIYDNTGGIYNKGVGKFQGDKPYNDTGGASRFFYTVHDAIDAADPLYYCAKASRGERDAGLEGIPLTQGFDKNTSKRIAHINHETGETTYNEYQPSQMRNSHPTVKPLDLCRYLATLLLPPAAYAPRRILIPFGGVCSEAIGAMLAGFEEIEIIEAEQEYTEIGAARMRYWQGKTLKRKGKPAAELPLFAEAA